MTTAQIVALPYDEAVIECIKKYHAIPTVKAMLIGKTKDIQDDMIVDKLHNNAEASNILNASTRILKSINPNKLVRNFSMSPELANAIGTVVVQALQENAKAEYNNNTDNVDSDDIESLGEYSEFDATDIPDSSRDAGLVESEEGPKYAPDLSAEVDELKNISSNNYSDTSRYGQVKDILNFSSRNIY